MLKIKKICLVGNATSLKGLGLGQKIDSYDFVIRCNCFKIKGYEKDVGTKTTHWLLTAFVAATPEIKEWSNCSNLEEVWVRYNSFTPPKYKEAVTEALSNVKIYHWIQPELSLLEEFNEKQPTSGLVGIVYALSRWPHPLDIVGFGTSEAINKAHYEESKVPSWTYHNLDIERLLINKWVSKGMVRRIDENYNTIS
tara:strand:+ start:1901 stop:2488 length:588 start_codon:yes stop_codon:yes gene_type:complete